MAPKYPFRVPEHSTTSGSARLRRITRTLLAGAGVAIGLLLQSSGPSGQTAPAGTAVKFDGINDFVTFGPATGPNGLNATNFTLELWFRQDGAGVFASTGVGGVEAYPLVAKGRNETDGGNFDTNYFLGLDSAGRLVADFEDMATGKNHSITGVGTVTPGSWHHAAATYDGQTWKLYLDGNLDAELTLPAPFQPRSDSIQHASIGAALNSTGVRNGAFNGVIDEVRIWNVVRTAAEIAQNHTLTITSGVGLIGRWGLDEGSGTVAGNSVPERPSGTLTNKPVWVGGFPFADATPPEPPQGVVADEGNGLLTLAWTPNTETDLAGYNIYRSAFAPVATTGTPLNGDTPVTSPIFTDRFLTNGSSYFYVVTAVDTSFNESSPSIEVSATPDFFSGAGMQFDGAGQYVTFGEAAGLGPGGLGVETFTIEAW
ncbi:MAG TPA: LamG-like jellyroll fold domain-containing protein, partial [Vicinamibacterales bacterium]